MKILQFLLYVPNIIALSLIIEGVFNHQKREGMEYWFNQKIEFIQKSVTGERKFPAVLYIYIPIILSFSTIVLLLTFYGELFQNYDFLTFLKIFIALFVVFLLVMLFLSFVGGLFLIAFLAIIGSLISFISVGKYRAALGLVYILLQIILTMYVEFNN